MSTPGVMSRPSPSEIDTLAVVHRREQLPPQVEDRHEAKTVGMPDVFSGGNPTIPVVM